jgi:hypothetical protein
MRKSTIIHASTIKVKNFSRRALITTESTGSRLDDIERSSAGRIAGIVHHKIRCWCITREIAELPGIIGKIIRLVDRSLKIRELTSRLAGLVVVFEMSFFDTGEVTIISAVCLGHVVENGITTIRTTSIIQ